MEQILTAPAEGSALSDLPRDIGALCAIVQGLLVHDAAVAHLYGDPPPDLAVDRTTRPVAERLERARLRHALPPAMPRPVFERQVGTCRDFAAMLCVLARRVGIEARVRCGFAAYFGQGAFEDHWVVAYRPMRGGVWHLADPQLDEAHRGHYSIDFDCADLPEGAFITADHAWQRWRSGAVRAGRFRHGDHHGVRLLFVNLVRDTLARSDFLTSPWDGWRELGDLSLPLGAATLALGDTIAAGEDVDLAALAGTDPRAVLSIG